MARAYVEIPLAGEKAAGKAALVDLEVYELVIPHRWHIWHDDDRAGHEGGPYAIAHIRVDGKRTTVMMHTLVMRYLTEGLAPWKKVDHENFDGLDNRAPNLRDGTKGNTHNQRVRLSASKTSKYKGVNWNKACGKWMARIMFENKPKYLGLYADEKDAARAYNKAALELFGEYAHLNVIEED
jgi:hypothetical protein